MFRDREDAGTQLAQKLKAYHGTEAVVLALPRGGVVIGERVAKGLELPLDIVDARGTRLCNEAELKHIDKKWFDQRVVQEQQEAQRRIALYRGKKAPISISGKTAIIVDDGIATGLTIRLAIKAVKEQKPMRVVVAVPVTPSDVAMKIKREADELVVLESPENFLGAVGAHYRFFPQVEDPEVIRLLSLI